LTAWITLPATYGDPPPPGHIAIIMDGNGRWAEARGLPRIAGHKRGAEAVRKTVEAAAGAGVSYLTLFGFSSENWKRPEREVGDLMGLLRLYLKSEINELKKNGIRLIDDEIFAGHLNTAALPDPDLLIRTSGEQRISNFLLWQLAYTELVFTDVLWPDFGAEDLAAAIGEYNSRERRYGATADSV
jgi:undecaprenyl diphosphate synthase